LSPEDFLNLDLNTIVEISTASLDKFFDCTPLQGLAPSFTQAQSKYTINVLFLVALAIHESDFGRSRIARDKNNLFGFRAYDRDPYNNAMYFKTKHDCILYVARYIKNNYLVPSGKYYNGPTLKGVNVRYATDPQWAYKVAKWMYKVNENVESTKDYNGHWAERVIDEAFQLGIIDGYADGSFKPDQPATRAEVVDIVMRVYHKIKEG